ncbi:hypothetical protein GOP47_0018971 [Adiantum capillus-veneris]|uniref:Uncharacterized protein n=1 Tax=Adiantum capillus-veneris TaxID=13818 RepID=A0A9D4UEQ4_ADICA|nr:hypothetical protein GOP47_0018971 [Adiantum capillus-veneris]
MGSRTYVGLDGWSTYKMLFGLPYRLTPSPRSPIPSAIEEPEPVSTHTMRSPHRETPGFPPRPIVPHDTIDDSRSRLRPEIDASLTPSLRSPIPSAIAEQSQCLLTQ